MGPGKSGKRSREGASPENQPGAGERAEFPQRKVAPNGGTLGKILWKEEHFFNSIVWQY